MSMMAPTRPDSWRTAKVYRLVAASTMANTATAVAVVCSSRVASTWLAQPASDRSRAARAGQAVDVVEAGVAVIVETPLNVSTQGRDRAHQHREPAGRDDAVR